jgi:hypothetical protein
MPYQLLHLLGQYIAQAVRRSSKWLFFVNHCLQPTQVLTQGVQHQSISTRKP